MKIFVAGATGAVGTPAVRQLVEAGHEVTGIARSPEKAELLKSLGAQPATVELFDGPGLERAIAGHEAVINLATSIPPMMKMALPGAWKNNDRIRREASRLLVDAALAGGATRYVQESIVFIYPDSEEWAGEDVPVDAPAHTQSVLMAESEARRFAEVPGGAGVVLRFAMFYGPGVSHTESFLRLARRGVMPLPGTPRGYVSSVHVEDAGAAVVAALRVPSGTYNVVEDEPVTRQAYAAALAGVVGRRRLRSVPAPLMKVGGSKTSLPMRSTRAANRRFKEASGWSPRYRSVREGFATLGSSAASTDSGRAAG